MINLGGDSARLAFIVSEVRRPCSIRHVEPSMVGAWMADPLGMNGATWPLDHGREEIDGEVPRAATKRRADAIHAMRCAEAARRCMEECPVQRECLQYALDNVERWGIWGGETPEQRGVVPNVRWRNPATRNRARDAAQNAG